MALYGPEMVTEMLGIAIAGKILIHSRITMDNKFRESIKFESTVINDQGPDHEIAIVCKDSKIPLCTDPSSYDAHPEIGRIKLDYMNMSATIVPRKSPKQVVREAAQIAGCQVFDRPCGDNWESLSLKIIDMGQDPALHDTVVMEHFRQLPFMGKIEVGGEKAQFSSTDVVIYHKSNWMRVTWHTSVRTVARFIRRGNYDYFDECMLCKKIQTKDVIRCSCCLDTFCEACIAEKYSATDGVLKQCPSCNVTTIVAHRHRRLMTFQFDIPRRVLLDNQALWKSVGSCAVCNNAGAAFVCACVLSARYCSKQCQLADWPEHKKVCTLRAGNVDYFGLHDWRYKGADRTAGALRGRVSIDFLMQYPLALTMIINCARARNEERKRKLARKPADGV
jgi:hypothetical protein